MLGIWLVMICDSPDAAFHPRALSFSRSCVIARRQHVVVSVLQHRDRLTFGACFGC
jgi:hypothetical protein